MQRKPHLLSLTIEPWGEPNFKITCPGDTDDCTTYAAEVWPDAFTCRCDKSTCPCREGMHEECTEGFPNIPEEGAGCRCGPMEGCGITEYVADAGLSDLLAAGDWNNGEYPIKAMVVWDHGYPELHPWKESE